MTSLDFLLGNSQREVVQGKIWAESSWGDHWLELAQHVRGCLQSRRPQLTSRICAGQGNSPNSCMGRNECHCFESGTRVLTTGPLMCGVWYWALSFNLSVCCFVADKGNADTDLFFFSRKSHVGNMLWFVKLLKMALLFFSDLTYKRNPWWGGFPSSARPQVSLTNKKTAPAFQHLG